MVASRSALLRWQFDLVWSLFEYHLERLHLDDFLWEPSALHWTMHQNPAGDWAPDWADTEPDPIPVPTIGWISWHIGWWWSVTLDHLHGRTPRDRTETTWPGPDSAIDWLRGLHKDWTQLLDQLDDTTLDAPAPFPWPDDPEMTVAHTLAWVNAELMKNASEIGQLRLLRAAGKP
ncbi:DinB family protein [Nocardia sp. NPDC127526]|uniref:DinB family protein n=1 Tax=Nocardia sp. NPDC127526 TaxID=3345393 RepID=UPI003637277C